MSVSFPASAQQNCPHPMLNYILSPEPTLSPAPTASLETPAQLLDLMCLFLEVMLPKLLPLSSCNMTFNLSNLSMHQRSNLFSSLL